MVRHTGEDFINVEGITIAGMPPLQLPSVQRAKFDTPKAYSFTADGYPAFSEQIFDVTVTQVEAIVEPDGIGNDIWRESAAFVGIHPPILEYRETDHVYQAL